MKLHRKSARFLCLVVMLLGCTLHAADGTSLVGHQAGIKDLDYSPDGTKLVSASRDATARVWSLESCQSLAMLRQDGPITHVRFVGNDRIVVVSEDPTRKVYTKIRSTKRPFGPASRIVVWDYQHDEVIPVESLGEPGRITHCSVAPDGERFAVRMHVDGPTGSGMLACVQAANGMLSFQRSFRTDVQAWRFTPGPPPPMIAFTSDGNGLVSVELSRRQDVLVMLNPESGVVEAEWTSGGRIARIDTSGPSPLLAAAVNAPQAGITAVRVWNTQTKQAVVETPPLHGMVSMLQFYDATRVGLMLIRDPSQRTLPGTDLFRGVALFDLASRQILPFAADETAAIGRGLGPQVGYDAAISPAARRAAVGFHLHDAVRIFSLDNSPPVTLKLSALQQSCCSHLGFSPSGRHVVAACNPADENSAGPEGWATKLLTVWDLDNDSTVNRAPTDTSDGQP